MEKVKVEDAVGTVLAHDLTKITPGDFKGAAYKKGYIIQKEDVELLKDMGKYHIHITRLSEDELHEDEAAKRLGEACMGEGLYLTEPSEGKVQIKAKTAGLLKVNKELLMQINEIEEIILSTCHTNLLVQKDQLVAGTKIIPLVTNKSNIEKVERLCQNGPSVLQIHPIRPLKTGVIVTGSEVYYKRIEDQFGKILNQKVIELGGEVIKTLYAPDDENKIVVCIKDLLEEGVELIMVSGGMAVDADDLTPIAIRSVTSRIVTYGSPVLPGAMFMLGYIESMKDTLKQIPILGVPACGMYRKITVLDLVLPRLFAGEVLTKKDIASMAHGGFCYNCIECRYPVCPMGKS